jgi:ABC-type sugar transport system substrate-binding protein
MRSITTSPAARRATAIAGTLAAIVALAACGSSSSSGSASSSAAASNAPASSASSSSSASSKHFVIGSVVNDLANPFLATMAKAEQAEAAKDGITIHVVSGSAGGTISIGQQISAVQQFISQHVNLILLTPSDPSAIVPAVKLANQANIPVIAVNTRVASGAKVVTFVGDDDSQYGVQEAKLVAQAIGGKGNVALLEGVLGDSPEVLRTNAIKATLAKYPNIHIVTSMVDAWTNPMNITDTQNLLSKYGNSLAAVVAEGPEMYAGAKLARSKGNSTTKFIAGDYSTPVEAAIKSGALYGTVNQDPALEGQMGVEYAFDYLTGKRSAIKTPQSFIPLPLVTSKNVNTVQAKWSS